MYVAGIDSPGQQNTDLSTLQSLSTVSNGPENARKAFKCATEIIAKLKQEDEQTLAKGEPGSDLVRIGCAFGTILGGIMSRYKFAYDVFGAPVDVAEALSCIGSPLSISLCENTMQVVRPQVDAFLLAHTECNTSQGSINLPTRKTELQFLTINPQLEEREIPDPYPDLHKDPQVVSFRGTATESQRTMSLHVFEEEEQENLVESHFVAEQQLVAPAPSPELQEV